MSEAESSITRTLAALPAPVRGGPVPEPELHVGWGSSEVRFMARSAAVRDRDPKDCRPHSNTPSLTSAALMLEGGSVWDGESSTFPWGATDPDRPSRAGAGFWSLVRFSDVEQMGPCAGRCGDGSMPCSAKTGEVVSRDHLNVLYMLKKPPD